MKLIKEVTVGVYAFKVATNKAILAQTLEANPEFSKIAFKNRGDNNSKDNSIEYLIETKSLGDVFKMNEALPEVIKYAFPLMLIEANDDSNANEIIDYIYKNEVDDVFNGEMLNFLTSAFTDGKQDKKPKVKFAMK